MFIPIRDSSFSLKKPYVTYLIITINIIVFLYQNFLPRSIYKEWFYITGLVPVEVFSKGLLENIPAFFSSLFVHGGILHLAGNMLYLWIFGDNIESTLGHIKYLFFYLACGIIATLVHLIINSSSSFPVVGASGAISGILGAYLIRYPRARIQILIWLIIFIQY